MVSEVYLNKAATKRILRIKSIADKMPCDLALAEPSSPPLALITPLRHTGCLGLTCAEALHKLFSQLLSPPCPLSTHSSSPCDSALLFQGSVPSSPFKGVFPAPQSVSCQYLFNVFPSVGSICPVEPRYPCCRSQCLTLWPPHCFMSTPSFFLHQGLCTLPACVGPQMSPGWLLLMWPPYRSSTTLNSLSL